MQLIKPMKQSVLYKTYEFMRRYYLSVGVLSAFYFDEGGELCTEQHLWERIGKEYGNLPLDYSMPKPVGEMLVRGYAYAPPGTTVTGREVWVTVGGLSRKLYALGERYWRDVGLLGRKPSEPQPFSRLALNWQNAYGGAGFAQNPLGKGHAPIETADGQRVHLLPNLLDPQNPQQESGGDIRPVCFDTIPYEWPQRMSLAGNYGGDWKEKHFPGFPPDIEWRVFNCAQPEQRLPEGFFRGDEAFELGGMHPEQEVLRGTLPDIRSRVFLNFTGAPVVKNGEALFTELPTRLDTVTFFPDLKLGVLCWRGVSEVFSEDTIELGQMLVAYEKIADPQRPIEHYRGELESRRFQPGRVPVALMNETPLIPMGARSGFADMLAECQKLTNAPVFENAKRRVDKAMEDVGRLAQITNTQPQILQAAQDLPAMPDMSPDKIHDADFEGYFKKLGDYAQKKSAERDAALTAMTKTLGDELLTTPMPLFSAEKTVQALSAFEDLRSMPEMVAYNRVPPPQQLAQRFGELQELARVDERRNGHCKPKFRLRSDQEQAYLRARLQDDLRRGNPLRDREFSACDFSGMDFSGRDLRGIDLRSCILRGCNFSGADLRDAILSHADLRDATCDRANAAGCGLAGADLRKANFTDADLSGAGLGGAVLCGGTFCGARFDKAQLIDGDWSGADFSRASLQELQAIKTNFRGAVFSGAAIKRCGFIECPFDGCDLRGAELFRVAFVNLGVSGTSFREARLKRVIFSNQPAGDMRGCDFAGSRMETVNFQNNDLRGANFKLARLYRCCFLGADMRECCLRGCDARESIFRRCNLEGANVSAANLAGASLRLARLVRTDFTDSNLIQSDLLKSQLGQTVFRGAKLQRTIMQDWRPEDDYGRNGERT